MANLTVRSYDQARFIFESDFEGSFAAVNVSTMLREGSHDADFHSAGVEIVQGQVEGREATYQQQERSANTRLIWWVLSGV
jgi:hypothetical protein